MISVVVWVKEFVFARSVVEWIKEFMLGRLVVV